MDLTLFFKTFLLAWFLVSVANLLNFIALWQRKEYRLDRLKSHWQTYQGKRGLFNVFWLVKFSLWLAFLVLVGGQIVSFSWESLLIFVFSLEAFWLLTKLVRRQLARPRLTAKAILVVISSLGFWFLFFLGRLFMVSSFRALIEANLLAVVWVYLAAGVWALPTRLIKGLVIRRARKKISQMKGLKVVGITGSFGKTSTKEFLASLLSSQYQVLATTKHNNTPIGVARQILKSLTPQHQVYVVEMGAYKKGEIKALCNLVSPEIGVLTGLGTQHLRLFGSLKKLLEAKYELIDSLPGQGLVVINGDNRLCRQLGEQTRLNKIYYSLDWAPAAFRAEKVKLGPEKVEFQARYKNQSYAMAAPLLGRQNVANLLASIVVARHLKVSWTQIRTTLENLRPLAGTMKLLYGPKEVKLVDDSYNSNPEGGLAALNYLAIFPRPRAMVFQPMIELGSATTSQHRRVLKKAAQICDQIFLTNKNFLSLIKAGLKKREWEKIKIVKSPQDLNRLLTSFMKKKGVILFEGRESDRYLNWFLKKDV